MYKWNQVFVFDTTLRDWQQCPWAWMAYEQNLEYAEIANKLGVDVLEAGFPSASKLDFKIVHDIASLWLNMVICGLCQLRESQVDITIEALKPAWAKGRLHTYLPVDPELLRASLWEKALDKEALLKNIHNFVSMAKKEWLQVEFSPEWYSRMWDNEGFALDCIRAAAWAWADVINCPDTIWWASKFEGEEYFLNKLKKHVDIIEREFPWNSIIWSCHNHNDFGIATENTMNCVFDWPVRQIEVTINGVWERAWNASLEQCVMIIKNFSKNLFTWINIKYLKQASDFIDRFMMKRQANLPIIWDNASKHTSWGHTNAVLNNPLAYQPFDPVEVGWAISLIFGPLSWGSHAKSVIEARGFKCEDSEKAEIAQFIKDKYHQRRKWITDDELIEWYIEFKGPIKIDSFSYSKTDQWSVAILNWVVFGKKWTHKKERTWKHSALVALSDLIAESLPWLNIHDYKSLSEKEWEEAACISHIEVRDKQWNWSVWIGRDEDIEISAMKAYIDAVNRYFVDLNFKL